MAYCTSRDCDWSGERYECGRMGKTGLSCPRCGAKATT